MEGINHKIKTIQHQTHGLRDERFFMLRLYALHQAQYKFIG
jgi:transposase